MRVQTRFHHSVQTSTATSVAEVTVELVCKRNTPRQLTGGEDKEDKNTKYETEEDLRSICYMLEL